MSVRNAVDYALDPEIIVFLVLGTGITAAFFDLGFAGLIFALGFGVLVPLSGILSGKSGEGDADEDRGRASDVSDDSVDVDEAAAIETLRERYARGEISEMEFERGVEDLLATESVDEAREYVAKRCNGGERDGTAERDRELERERR